MSGDLVEVHLRGLPIAIHHEMSRHLKALQREFDLIRQGDPDNSDLPARLLDLITQLRHEFGGIVEQIAEGHPEDVVGASITKIDLSYRVPRSAGHASRYLDCLLDEADAYCARGEHLLTMITPPEALRYRKWLLSEFARQTDGLTAVSWADYREFHPQPGNPTVHTPDPDRPVDLPEGWTMNHRDGSTTLTVSGAIDLLSAPALRDALASLLPAQDRLVVDLSECDFLDSVGVGVLMAAHLRALEDHVELTFRFSGPAQRVVDISGLSDRLPVDTE